MDGDKNQIYHLAEQCASLFKTLSDHPKFVDDDWLEDRAADFTWWSHSIKAQKTGRSSLDYRLRSRPDVQKIIANLLESLIFTLDECLQSGTETHNDIVSINDFIHAGTQSELSATSDDNGSDSSWSEFSDEDQSAKEGTSSEKTSEDEDVKSRFYIKTYIGLLTKFSIAIRKSGTTLRYLKADEYLKDHYDDDEYQQLRQHLVFVTLAGLYEQRLFEELHRQAYEKRISKGVELVIRSWIVDPSRLTNLQRRFIEMNITRRNRILYEIEKSGKRPLKRVRTTTKEPRPTASQVPLQADIEGEDAGIFMKTATKIPTPSQAPSKQTESSKSMTATELGSQFVAPTATLLDPLEPRKASSVMTKMTQTGAYQDYPPCPAKKGSFQCPYCVQLLSEEYLVKSRWRGHVAQDLNPYSCIYETCSSSHEFFATKDQWIQHTTGQHSIERWVCDECTFREDLEEEPVFDTEQDWELHMNSCHKSERAQLALLSSISKRRVPKPASCPLCRRPNGCVRPDQDEHIAEHLHSWALRALPWTSSTENQDSDSDAIAGSNNDLARMSDLSSFPDDPKFNDEISFVLPSETYRSEIPDYLKDFDFDYETPEYKNAVEAMNLLPSPPKLPDFLAKPILNSAVLIRDDKGVLDMPNHTTLNHLTTSSIKNDVLGISSTTRYRTKYVTTIWYRPYVTKKDEPASVLEAHRQPLLDVQVQRSSIGSMDDIEEHRDVSSPVPDNDPILPQPPPKRGFLRRLAQIGTIRRTKKKDK